MHDAFFENMTNIIEHWNFKNNETSLIILFKKGQIICKIHCLLLFHMEANKLIMREGK